MPIVSLSIQQQLKGVSSGVNSFPQIGQVKQDTVIIDEFTRETLNPTNAIAIYTATSNDGNGTAVIN